MASGDTLLTFHPYNNEPPASVPALIGRRNIRPILRFNKDVNWSAVFSSVMPQNYSGATGVGVYLHISADGITTGDIVVDVSFERVGDGIQDTDADGFAAVNSITITVPGTDGDVGIDVVTFTDGADMDSIAVGELFRIKVTRDAVDGSDDAAADAQLHAVEIRET